MFRYCSLLSTAHSLTFCSKVQFSIGTCKYVRLCFFTYSHSFCCQRSAVTAATAGSDAGVGSLAYFSEEESGESSNQEEEESDGAESDDHDNEDSTNMLDEQLERRAASSGELFIMFTGLKTKIDRLIFFLGTVPKLPIWLGTAPLKYQR